MSNRNDYVDISSSSQVNKVYKKKHSKGRGLRITTLILSIIMLLSGTGLVYYYNVLDSLNYKEIDDPEPSSQSSNSSSLPDANSSLLSSTQVLNILLFGQDAVDDGEETGRSDSMILLSLDNVHHKIKLTSFQRDTYVTIPGYGDAKINAAFQYGGVPLSIKTVEANFGIAVDKYATVDFDSFRKIINILGGVDIELSLEEIKYINAQIDVNDQIGETQFLQYDPSKDPQMIHLDGYQALWYARDRGEEALGGNPEYTFSGDDWDRTKRQRKLLETILNDLREKASLTDLVQIVNEIGPLVTTNLKKGDITFLVQNIMTYINYDMIEISIPIEGCWRYGTTDDGQSVIVITDWDKTRMDLASFIYEDAVVTSSQAGQSSQYSNSSNSSQN